jgi:hypothetical protein
MREVALRFDVVGIEYLYEKDTHFFVDRVYYSAGYFCSVVESSDMVCAEGYKKSSSGGGY